MDERARVLAGLEHDPAYSNPPLAELMRRWHEVARDPGRRSR